ncbi:unnamed protein product, partial [Rotaria sp. Silwood2]
LTKQLRLILKDWNFTIDKKERKQTNESVKSTSTNNNTHTASVMNLTRLEENEPSSASDEEPQEDSTRTTDKLHPLIDEKKQLSLSAVADDVQNPTTTTTLNANKKNVNNSSKGTSSSSLSSPIDTESQIHFSSLKEENIEASASVL